MAQNQNQVSMPGYGGLMRYKEEYDSAFKFGPVAVVAAIILTIILILGLNIFFPIV